MRILLASALSISILAMPAAAPATAQTTHDEQVWLNATVMGKVGDRLLYFAEVQPRIGDHVSRLDQLIVRPAIGWQISKTVSVYQGYAHVFVPVEGRRDRNEERSFQQLSWTIRPGATEVQSRTRVEQRWLSNGRDVGWRLRELVRAETPLSSGTRVKALGSIEGFVALNSTDWGARGGFDQVRAFAGVEVPLKGKSTIEAGYLNQYVNDPAGRARMRHVASIALFVRP